MGLHLCTSPHLCTKRRVDTACTLAGKAAPGGPGPAALAQPADKRPRSGEGEAAAAADAGASELADDGTGLYDEPTSERDTNGAGGAAGVGLVAMAAPGQAAGRGMPDDLPDEL
jgi:hypothetical protein